MTEIEKYVNKRYKAWLDYSKFKCSSQGLESESIDVLNSVLIEVLSKDEAFLTDLYQKKKGPYRELDFFILKIIAVYASSDTAPYRAKYRNKLPIDANIEDISRLDIIDEKNNDRDLVGRIVFEVDLVRFIFERLDLEDIERFAFEQKFFFGETVSELTEVYALKSIYAAYNTVENVISTILASEGLAKQTNKKKHCDINRKRVEMIINIFNNSHLKELKAKKKEINSILK